MTTFCIIVCYRPDRPRLHRLCEHLLADGARIILIDNTEVPYLKSDDLPSGVRLITLGYNSGIAHAQNVGVAEARAAGAAVIVFFDQDSSIEIGFLRALVAPLKVGSVEIVAPLYRDETSNRELPSLRLNRLGLAKPVHGSSLIDPYPVDIVIASATAAKPEVFDMAGIFDESLFIDFVDTEWCLRCRGTGVSIHVVPSAVMRHSIGSGMIQFGPLTILVHSPTRCYYQIRNCFHLLRKRHVPILFSLKQLLSVVLNRILLLIFVEDRMAYLTAYMLALRDGIRGNSGAKPS